MYTLVDVGVLPGLQSSEATGVNRRGEVVGYCSGNAQMGYPRRAFHWRNGVMQDLGTLGGNTSEAHPINDRGQVVGRSTGRLARVYLVTKQRDAADWVALSRQPRHFRNGD